MGECENVDGERGRDVKLPYSIVLSAMALLWFHTERQWVPEHVFGA